MSTKKMHVYLMSLYKSVILLLSVPWRVLSFPYIDRLDPVLLVATPQFISTIIYSSCFLLVEM